MDNSQAMQAMAQSGVLQGAPQAKPAGGLDQNNLIKMMMMQSAMKEGKSSQDYLSKMVMLLMMGGLGDKKIDPRTGKPGGQELPPAPIPDPMAAMAGGGAPIDPAMMQLRGSGLEGTPPPVDGYSLMQQLGAR